MTESREKTLKAIERRLISQSVGEQLFSPALQNVQSEWLIDELKSAWERELVTLETIKKWHLAMSRIRRTTDDLKEFKVINQMARDALEKVGSPE